MKSSRRIGWLAALAALVLAPLVASGGRPGARSDVFAAIQFEPAAGRTAENLGRLTELVRQAAGQGARYVVLPELATTGALREGAGAALAESGPALERFSRLAAELGIWLAVSLPERDGESGGYHISTVLLGDRGQVLFRYHKILPRWNGEDGPALRGNPRTALLSLDDEGRRVGVLAGDDLLAGVPQLASRGAETILVSAAWSPDDPVAWAELCQRLSREHGVHLVVANRLRPGRGTRVLGGIYSRGGERVSAPAAGIVKASLEVPFERFRLASPLGLPSVPVPASDSLSPELVQLGRDLFFDTKLSKDGSVSCATCHQPDKGFSNGQATGTGIYGKRTPRNVPSLLNVVYKGALFWDGYAGTLENQAKYPTTHAFEMDSPYLDGLLGYVRGEPSYAGRFRDAMGVERIEFDHIAKALAMYQRTLVSGNSPFDRFSYGGQHEALSPPARRGLELFTGKAGCAGCHHVGERHALFTDNEFHNTGVGYDRARGAFSDAGLGLLSDSSREGLFFTPSLRNVEDTAPYMHDGSFASLEEVVAFYDRGGVPNPGLDPKIRALRLSRAEKADLVSFLRSLKGDQRFSPLGVPLQRKVAAVAPKPGDLTKFAVVRISPRPRAIEENRAELARLIARAAGQGARYAVLPEYALTGPLTAYEERELRELAQHHEAESFAFFSRLARQHEIWISVPVVGLDPARKEIHQASLLIDSNGGLALRQRKISTLQERGDGPTAAGNLKTLRIALTPTGWMGVLSGDDFLEGAPRLAELGASTILVSASWEDKDAIDWDELSVRMAETHKVNLVVSNLDAEAGKPGLFVALVGEGGKVSRLAPPAGVPVISASIAAPSLAGAAETPLGLPPLPRPVASHASPESVMLGRQLFFDRSLSSDGSISCSSCHDPERAFADERRVAKGVRERIGHRNTPSLLNSGYRPFLFWEGRVRTLEDQVAHALHGWAEMNTHTEEALKRVRANPSYRASFRQITGRDTIRFEDVSAALASYERTLISGSSPFDRWYYGGDESAVNARAKEGFKVFIGPGRCASCHTIGESWALFSDHEFHNTGVAYHQRFEYLGYGGDGLENNMARDNSFHGEYLTPTLRNIALTAPYMHDGSVATLREVVDFYERGGIANPHLDSGVRPIKNLTERDKENLVEFLLTLTGEAPASERELSRKVLAVSRRKGVRK
jgi:cytochrome c peroxidase